MYTPSSLYNFKCTYLYTVTLGIAHSNFTLCYTATLVDYTTPQDGHLHGDFMLSTTDRDSLVLSVAACEDARVALMEIPGILTQNTYEVVFGTDNNRATIIKDGTRDNVYDFT